MLPPPLRALVASAAGLSTSIWLFFLFLGPQLSWRSMDEFLVLHENPIFPLKWVLSMVSFAAAAAAMGGLHLRLRDREPGYSLLGFAFFLLGTVTDTVYRAVESITVQTLWARKALAAADAAERAAWIDRIQLFQDFGEGAMIVFGTFFVLGFLGLGLGAWNADRWLAATLLAGGTVMACVYGAALLGVSAPRPVWVGYELLMIALYVRLGWFLLHAPEPPAAAVR